MSKITRRGFLRGALAVSVGAVGAGALSACGLATTKEKDVGTPVESEGSSAGTGTGVLPWLGEEPQISDADIESEVSCDVIIVGCGLAGVAAARAAAEEGARVVVFEKAGGPQSRSGDFAVINGKLAARWGRDNMDPDILADSEMIECAYIPKRKIYTKWMENGADVFDWFIEAKDDLYICDTSFEKIPENTECALFPYHLPLPEGYDWTKEKFPCFPTSVGFSPDQTPVVKANMAKATAEGAQAFYGHFVEKLIMEGGRCVGCYARNASSGKYVKATAGKGVILATGDYSSNQEILDHYCPEVRQNGVKGFFPGIDVEGNPINTGDGLKLGSWVGAAIQQHHAPMIHWPAFNPANFTDQTVMGCSPFLLLNKEGKRFTNEDVPGQQLENQVELQRDRIVFQIFDSKWKEQVPRFAPQHGARCYVIDDDMQPNNINQLGSITQAQFNKSLEQGVTVKADTLDALLDMLEGIDKQTALKSIERYNQMAKNGKDEDFGKVPSRLFPVEAAPFYASKATTAVMLVCLGGLESDEECHVYDDNRIVIPGLYVAGNIQGNRFAIQYPIPLKGASHSLALYYGYVAGKNAVKQI